VFNLRIMCCFSPKIINKDSKTTTFQFECQNVEILLPILKYSNKYFSPFFVSDLPPSKIYFHTCLKFKYECYIHNIILVCDLARLLRFTEKFNWLLKAYGILSDQAMSWHAMSFHVMLYHDMPYHDIPCHIMSCYNLAS